VNQNDELFEIPYSKFDLRSVGLISLYFYLLFSFITRPLSLTIFTSIAMWLTIGISILLIFDKITLLIFNRYLIMFGLLLLSSFSSSIYSVDESNTLGNALLLVPSLIICTTAIILIQTREDILGIIKCFSFCGLALVLTLWGTNMLEYTAGYRLGNNLYTGANELGRSLMFSQICALWLAINEKRFRYLNIANIIVMSYAMFLTGSRKYIIVIIIFACINLIFKSGNIMKKLTSLVIILLGSIIVYTLVMKVPSFYDLFGYRLESLFSFFSSDYRISASDDLRKYLIERGVAYFTERPIFGWGHNSYQVLFGLESGYLLYSHNNYIELLVNLGLIGFVIYYSYYFILVKRIYINKISEPLDLFFIGFIIGSLILDIGDIGYEKIFVQLFLAITGIYVFDIKNLKGNE